MKRKSVSYQSKMRLEKKLDVLRERYEAVALSPPTFKEQKEDIITYDDWDAELDSLEKQIDSLCKKLKCGAYGD